MTRSRPGGHHEKVASSPGLQILVSSSIQLSERSRTSQAGKAGLRLVCGGGTCGAGCHVPSSLRPLVCS